MSAAGPHEMCPAALSIRHMSTHNDIDAVRNEADVPPSNDSEGAAVERFATGEGDSGEVETLPNGSISIPILEEELVVTKRIVVRERIVVRKELVTETEHVEADLRRERIEVDEGDGTSAA